MFVFLQLTSISGCCKSSFIISTLLFLTAKCNAVSPTLFFILIGFIFTNDGLEVYLFVDTFKFVHPNHFNNWFEMFFL